MLIFLFFFFQTAEEYIANSLYTKKANAAILSTSINAVTSGAIHQGQNVSLAIGSPTEKASGYDFEQGQKFEDSGNGNDPSKSSSVDFSKAEASGSGVAKDIKSADAYFGDEVDDSDLILMSQDTFDPNDLDILDQNGEGFGDIDTSKWTKKENESLVSDETPKGVLAVSNGGDVKDDPNKVVENLVMGLIGSAVRPSNSGAGHGNIMPIFGTGHTFNLHFFSGNQPEKK